MVPDPEPDFRISAHAVEIGAERATCSQNFRPLAAVVPEMLRPLTTIKYRMTVVTWRVTLHDSRNMTP